MSSLKVPESGLQLLGGHAPDIPPQAFSLSLSDSVIESLIRNVRDGGEINLRLGPTPTLHYGNKSHRIEPSDDTAPFDIYLTKPFESTRDATRLPNTSTLFDKLAPSKKPAAAPKAAAPKAKAHISSKSSTSSGIDSDLEALKDGLAAHDKARERAHIVNKLPATGRGAAKAKGKLLAGYNSTPRSLPTSPALNGIGSPSSTPALSASQQLMERNKEQRSSLVHELASQDQTQSYLQDRWDGAEEDFKYHLEKVGEHSQDSKKWTLKTMYWKELNVWEYDYDTQEDRQMAIDNAIRKYDKQRVDPSDSLWEKLLPKDERGKGKCLSRLQAKLDKGPPPTASNAPKIKIQKADDSSTSREDGDASDARSGGESMSRTKSNPLPTKATKPSAQDAQYKRMLNPKARAAPQKPSPTKAKDTSSKPNGKRILSQAIIENSDSSGDEAVIVNTQPPPKPASKPPVKAPATKPRPAVKEPAKSQPIKRPRQEEPDDSSSSSEAPLAQRLPQKQARQIKPVKQQQRHMESNSQAARGSSTSSSQPQRHKNTSPVKSSPLASSPPTNASDFETNAPRSKKRKAEDDVPARSAKRSASRSVPTEVMTRAQRFKMYYQKYEALHNEVSSLSNPPDDKVADLVDMRNRLEGMKREIYRRFQAVSA